jgi:hypothetical protein
MARPKDFEMSSGAVFQFAAAEAAGVGGCCPLDARSPETDFRVCCHEAGHAIAARLLGLEVGGCTVDPSNGFGGMCWGPRFVSALARTDTDSVNFSQKLRSYMPQPGEDHRDESAAVLLQHALNYCIELVSGQLAEEMLLPGSAPTLAADDLKQQAIYASLVVSTPEACEAFVALARTMAVDLLSPHKEIIRALADALRAQRTMTGGEIDLVIARALAVEAIRVEHARREQWRRIEQGAAMFERIREHTDCSP